jgi:hypothetical protein
MEKSPDFAQLWREAMDSFVETYKDMRRQTVKETNTPLEGERLTPAERRAWGERLLSDDLEIAGQFEELSARFQVPAGRVPRRLWEAVKAAAKEE